MGCLAIVSEGGMEAWREGGEEGRRKGGKEERREVFSGSILRWSG